MKINLALCSITLHVERMNETENQSRLRQVKESLAAYRSAESQARKALADAVESTKRCKERYEELFIAEDLAECARRKASYRHQTK